ncbi:MAG: hypothetical protein ACOC7U_08405 [Spirochaetota bacterium]
MKKVFIVMAILFLVGMVIGTQASAEGKNNKEPGIFSRKNPHKTGLIFNVNDILLDVDSYQGGVGLKRYWKEKMAYRAMFDFGYSKSSSSWLVSAGGTVEHHFIPGQISPYIGGFLDAAFTWYKDETDADNWTKVASIPISAGPVLGLEVAVFNVLSLFAEYSITLDFTYTITKQSVAGSESKDTSTDFGVSTGMGNDAKIGVVVYFNRVFKRSKKQDV